ncbi:MAG: aminotransferase class V-fold PLP-dependent enzyme, partial [Myxococcota bacterium]
MPRHQPEVKMKDWQAFREQFPVTRRYVYMNHAAVSPLPAPCVQRMQAYLDELSLCGAAHYPRSISAILTEVRGLGARILGTRPSNVFVVRSTTQGLGIAATGFPFRQGDNVVLAEREFPANLRPWMPLARK